MAGNKLVPLIVGLLILMLVAGIVQTLDSSVREQRQQELEARTLEEMARLRAQLESELNTTIFLTHGLAAYVAANPELQDDAVERMARNLLRRSVHVRHVALAPDNVVSHIYPLEGNEAALGLDYLQQPAQRVAVERAMEQRQLVVAGPVDLVQGGRALATREPIYLDTEGNAEYWGLVTSIIRMGSLMEAAGFHEHGEVPAALRDRDSGTIIHGDPALFRDGVLRLPVRLPGADWELAGLPADSASVPLQAPWTALGYLFALLAGGMAWRISHQGLRIRASERQYRTLIENLPDGVCITRGGRFQLINPRLAAMTGYQPAELRGRPITDLVHPEDRDTIQAQSRRALRGTHPASEFDTRVLRADGTILHTRLNTSLITWDTGSAALTTVTDITERKKLQAALEESRDRLAAMIEALPDVAYLLNADGICLDVFGGRDSRLADASRDLVGRNLGDVLPADAAQRCQDVIHQAIASGRLQILIYSQPSTEADANCTQWFEARAVPLRRAPREQPAVLWLAFDITSHKEIELQLRRRETSFQALVENSPDVISRMDRELRYLYISPSVEHYSGIPPEAHIGRTSWEVGVPAELAERWEAQFRRVFAGEGPQTLEFSLRAPDGQMLYFESRAMPEPGPDGTIDTILVIDREITAQKRNESQLRLAASVFHNTSEAMLVSDAEHRVVRCNPAFARLTGFRQQDLIGRTPEYLRAQSANGLLPDDCWELVASSGHWEGEVAAHRHDGEAFAAWLTISAIRDVQQEITHYLLVVDDISLRKRWEQRMRHEATHDPLTSLPNRTLLLDRLQVTLAQARRNGQPLALLFIDLDNFKPINDDLGHRVGDRVLRVLAGRMREGIRQTDTVARLGGDEFVVVLMPPTPFPVVENIARDLLSKIPEPIELHGDRHMVTASIGIARYPEDGDTPEALINAADAAMYEAKSSGRARYQFRTPATAPNDEGPRD